MSVAGESNVYTIGYIGEHKVVSTKLPAVGFHRAAQIATGNTTTRLLGKQISLRVGVTLVGILRVQVRSMTKPYFTLLTWM